MAKDISNQVNDKTGEEGHIVYSRSWMFPMPLGIKESYVFYTDKDQLSNEKKPKEHFFTSPVMEFRVDEKFYNALINKKKLPLSSKEIDKALESHLLKITDGKGYGIQKEQIEDLWGNKLEVGVIDIRKINQI